MNNPHKEMKGRDEKHPEVRRKHHFYSYYLGVVRHNKML